MDVDHSVVISVGGGLGGEGGGRRGYSGDTQRWTET